MKKLALALVCLVSVAFFASCSPEGDPTISVYDTEDGYVKSGDNVTVGEEFKFGFDMASSVETSKELTSLVVTITTPDNFEEEETLEFPGNVTEYNYRRTYTFNPKSELVGVITIKAVVTDAAGKTATVTMELNAFESDALVEADFTWNRHGGAAATGLEQFGLQWTSNGKEDFAQIKPLEGAKLYKFDAEKWATVTTGTEKAALFSEQTLGISVFNEISAWTGHDYDYVIGTTYNGENYLIHITKAVVTTFKGTDITITGQWK